MVFTFYKARGLKVGSSLVEEDKLDLAKKLEEMAKAKVGGVCVCVCVCVCVWRGAVLGRGRGLWGPNLWCIGYFFKSSAEQLIK